MRKILITLVLICAATVAMAAPVINIYEAKVPVASQSSDLQKAALQQALSQVFVKASGSSSVVKNTGIQSAIANPENYLLSYNYFDGVLPDGTGTLYLRARFDSKSIDVALKNNGYTIWSHNRPVVLIWAAINQTNIPPALLAATNQSGIVSQLKSIANQRALPIIFPILDLQDLKTVSVNTIITPNINLITQASGRYSGDAILALNLQQMEANTWNGNWTLVMQGTTTTWQTKGTLEQTVDSGMNAVTDNLAARFSTTVNNTAASNVQLTVVNIQNLQDYAKVLNYLKGLPAVKQVEVDQVQPSKIVYNISITGGVTALQQALSLDHRLQPLTNSNSMPNATVLVYQWVS